MELYKVLPSTNLSVLSVRNTLGVYEGLAVDTRDVGTLCKNAKSKWSKFKPVSFPHPTALEAPDIRTAYPDWYRGFNGNCGLTIPNYTTMASMFTALRAGTEGWDYTPPTTGPFRLLDFAGYDVDAQPPFIPLNLADTYYATSGAMGCALDLRVPSESELTVDDLGYTWNLGEMYFGVAISRQGTTTYKYMTDTTTISSGSGSGVDVPLDGELGTYNVVYFLAETIKSSFTSPDVANTFIPIPYAMQTILIKDSAVSVTITAVWDAGKTNYELYVNSENGSLTLNNCFLNIKYGDNPMPSASQSGEVTISLGTIVANTVPESGPVRTGNVVSLPDYNTRLGGLIYFTNSSYSAYNMHDMIGSID